VSWNTATDIPDPASVVAEHITLQTLPILQSPTASHDSLSCQLASCSTGNAATPVNIPQPAVTLSTCTDTIVAASTASPASSAQKAYPANFKISSITWQGFNVQTVFALILTVMGFAWAIKSVQEASLANQLAREEACRVHSVSLQ
jgi:hypothetical protein